VKQQSLLVQYCGNGTLLNISIISFRVGPTDVSGLALHCERLKLCFGSVVGYGNDLILAAGDYDY
jgi:hypothetical protein